MGFILPGCTLVCIVSWLYTDYGVTNPVVVAIMAGRSLIQVVNSAYETACLARGTDVHMYLFVGVKDVVSAAVLFSVYNLGRHAFLDHETKEISMSLLFLGFFGALQVCFTITVASACVTTCSHHRASSWSYLMLL